MIAGGAWWFLNANRPAGVATKAPAEAARLSIVVLPFANLSGDPGQDYLVDALTDELTTSLARLRDTFVIARNTAMTFKGKPIDAKAIGKDLGVRYVLEGSVQPSGDRMRVNAQLIDAGSGAHLWAEQFDTPRADLLQTQDAIVTHLAHAIGFQLYRGRGRPSQTDARGQSRRRGLGSSMRRGRIEGRIVGKEADAAYALCEQALAIDPNNVRALRLLGLKFLCLAALGVSGDPKGDLERADELESKALALDPDLTWPHQIKGDILRFQGRTRKPSPSTSAPSPWTRPTWAPPATWASTTECTGNSTKALNISTRRFWGARTIRGSPHWYGGKAVANFGLKNYDQAIELARQAIAINPNYVQFVHATLVAALALTGHDAEAGEALQRYLALPSTGPLKTIAAWKAYYSAQGGGPPRVEMNERTYDGLRKAGMPEE